MPHLYCDRRSDNEETQKLIHRNLLANLSQVSAKLYGKECPFSWDQAGVVATKTRDDGFSVVAFLRQEVTADLAKKRVSQQLVRAFGCQDELKRTFTMAPPKRDALSAPMKVKSSCLSLKNLTRKKKQEAPVVVKVEAPPDAGQKAVGAKSAGTEEENIFFTTVAGHLIHCRAPGEAWKQLCIYGKTLRVVLEANVVEVGNFEQAKHHGGRFCPRCLTKAGLSLR